MIVSRLGGAVVKVLLVAVTAAILGLGLYLAWAMNTYSTLPLDSGWQSLPESSQRSGEVTVRFTGTTTVLFSDGETHWMIDGWFSRPGPLTLALGEIAPDMDAITAGLAANEVSSLAAVIPMHSHFDHAMDAPEVARRTGAVLMGSESTANIGRGWGLPESRIQVIKDRQSFQLGDFKVTPIVSRHFQFPDSAMRERALDEPEISAPLVPPVTVDAYRLGKAWVLHVEHPAGTFAIVGSAGYRKGALQDLPVDTIFLGIGGLGSQSETYRQAYWHETVTVTGAQRVIPVHFDSLTGPIEGPFRGPANIMKFLSRDSGETLPFIKEKLAERPGLSLRLMPRYTEVTLYPAR